MCWTGAATRRPCLCVAGQLHDERHVHRLVVEKQPVLLLAVIAEPFAVIRQQHDRRPIVEPDARRRIEQTADDLVGVSDLAVVRRVHREPRRRCVGLVRLVEMEEQEEWLRPAGSSHFSAAARVFSPSR